ncbi:MAG TPA: helix-turn-helix domain-containing protein [Candidatus Angelobacter sp.]|nr:helix-turn-helix domain-containing protein [Candidatus Angelobacter sp.]
MSNHKEFYRSVEDAVLSNRVSETWPEIWDRFVEPYLRAKPSELSAQSQASTALASGIVYAEYIAAQQAAFIAALLAKYKGNRSKVARELHVHRNTLARMIEALQIDTSVFRRSGRRKKPQTVSTGVDRRSIA